MPLVYLSHLINIAVTGTLVWLFVMQAPSMDSVYGLDTPARRILASVYFAIGIASLLLLGFAAIAGVLPFFVHASIALFALQIIYKTATAVAIGTGHPVVISNLIISAVHAVSLAVLVNRQ